MKPTKPLLSAGLASNWVQTSTCSTPYTLTFRYRATDPSGIVENEVCPVYAAHIVSELQLNPDEVMDCQWSNLEDVLSGIDATPWAFSPWMVMQVANKEARALLQNYCQQIIA